MEVCASTFDALRNARSSSECCSWTSNESRAAPTIHRIRGLGEDRRAGCEVAREGSSSSIGQMRLDKGLDRLPAIFELIPDNKRKLLSLAFCGRGDCQEIIAKMTSLLEVSRMPADRFLSDIEVAQELAKSDVLLAPYRFVTASGTVVLALCRGLSVIAYDTGALGEIVRPDGLVRLKDECEFAERIGAAIETGGGGPVRSLQAWRQASLEAWLEAVHY